MAEKGGGGCARFPPLCSFIRICHPSLNLTYIILALRCVFAIMEHMRMLLCACLGLCLMVSCEPEKQDSAEPSSPQEMYEHAQALLKPNAEHDASDTEGALVWLRRAAEGGYLQAQTDLAGIYLSGSRDGKVKPEPAEAFRWFTAAAEQGSKEAYLFLGMLRYDGKGMFKDEIAAVAHWRVAAEADIAEAQFRLGRVLARRPDSSKEGIDWLRRAVREGQRGGVPQAATALGAIYMKGINVPADAAEAAKWYELGATGGDPLAQLVFSQMLMLGDPVPRDEQRGMAMLRMAAGQDYPQAIALLINLLRNAPDAAAHEKEADAWSSRLQKLTDKQVPGPR